MGKCEVRKCWWGYVEANEGGGEECEGRGRGDEEYKEEYKEGGEEECEEECEGGGLDG